MKYSPSVRLINIIVNFLLFGGFGFLGVWYGFFITPHMLMQTAPSSDVALPEISVALTVMLGAFGVSCALVALVGFVNSVRSFLHASDDSLVVKSFGSYIGIGYLITAFCFLNAIWLYRLTSSNIGDTDVAFVIVVFAVLTVVGVIATNVPLVRMFGEGEHTNTVMTIIASTLAAGTGGVGLVMGVLWATNIGNTGKFAFSQQVLSKIGVLTLLILIACLLAGVAVVGYGYGEKHNKIFKANGFLYEGSLFITGGSIIAAGLYGNLEYYYLSENISLMAKTFHAKFADMYEFAAMSYITGGLIVIFSLILAYLTVFPPKAPVEQ